VIITHAHPDHMVDLHGLLRARWFGRRGAPPIPLYAPEPVLARLIGLEDDGPDVVRRVFEWHPLPSAARAAGPLRLESWPLPHYLPNAGVRLSGPGLTLAYTGDTGADPALAELGRDADLYIVDATDRWQRPDGPAVSHGPSLNLNAGIPRRWLPWVSISAPPSIPIFSSSVSSAASSSISRGTQNTSPVRFSRNIVATSGAISHSNAKRIRTNRAVTSTSKPLAS